MARRWRAGARVNLNLDLLNTVDIGDVGRYRYCCTLIGTYFIFLFNNDVPLLFLCCSSAVPLFENTGAGSLDQILVAQVKSGEGAAAT